MTKPLNKTTAGIMGSALSIIGATGIVFTIFQQTNPGVAFMIGLFSGSLAVGVGIETAVRMSSRNRDTTNDVA